VVTSPATLEIRPAQPNECRAAMDLSFALPGQSPHERDRHVAAFVRYAEAMKLDLNRHWLTIDAGTPVSACSVIISPGRTAILFIPPAAVVGAAVPRSGPLVDHALAFLREGDLRLAQCLVLPEDQPNQALLVDRGFREIATLMYMECRLQARDAVTPTPPRSHARAAWIWMTYSAETHAAFADLVQQTYRGSLDCPAMTGLRNIDDVLAGHRAAGRFRPELWWMLCRDHRPVACILLAENPLQPVVEIAYMGVHPEVRGQGVGRFVLDSALEQARRQRYHTMMLAVDRTNAPACRLYEGAGFRETMRRCAFLHVFGASSESR